MLSLAATLALVGHPATRVPRGVREIDLRSPAGVVRMTERAKVMRIVRWFDRLPTIRPGVFACPGFVQGPTIGVVFREADAGIVARARYAADTVSHSLVSTQCDAISLSVDGAREKPLVGGRFLVRVQRLLGVRLL